jgi:hypothetical protein
MFSDKVAGRGICFATWSQAYQFSSVFIPAVIIFSISSKSIYIPNKMCGFLTHFFT